MTQRKKRSDLFSSSAHGSFSTAVVRRNSIQDPDITDVATHDMVSSTTLDISLLGNLMGFVWTMLRPRRTVAIENLFLRKQLAMFRERGVTPRRPNVTDRLTLMLPSSAFDWKDSLIVVGPRTLTRWHRPGFRMP